jgi:hypothetical protein
VARVGEKENLYNLLVEQSEGKIYLLEDIGIGRWIILKLIIKKYGGKMWTEFIWLRIGCCEHGNETSFFIKFREFIGC